MTPKKKEVKVAKTLKKTPEPETAESAKKTKISKKSIATPKPESFKPAKKAKSSKKSNVVSKPESSESAKKNKSSKPTDIAKKTKTKSKVKKTIKKSKVSKLSLRQKAVRNPYGKTKLTSRILKRSVLKIPKKEIKSTRGVVYLSNVPHGFYEGEMKKFFSQFGQVTGVRIPRSTRTGRYRGYAFVEFMYPDVAKIAAETMNNYLMYKRLVKAKYLSPEDQKPYAFRFKTPKVPLVVRRRRYLRRKSNRVLTDKESELKKQSLNSNVQKKMEKLKKLGINYEFQVSNRESTNSEKTTA